MFITDKFSSFEIREFEILDSTQEEAKRIIKSKHQNNTILNNIVIFSHNQTNGRGRNGKEWISDEGNLFFSIIIDSNRIIPPEIVSYIAGLSVHDSLKNNSVTTRLKWPNDILIEGKKLCGILIEKFDDFLIIGIGININSSPQYLDSGRKACCLKDHIKDIDTKKLLNQILDNFGKRISDHDKYGFENIGNEYKQDLYKLNEEIELDYLGKRIRGIIRDITKEGNLVIETTTGLQEYRIGEIFDL